MDPVRTGSRTTGTLSIGGSLTMDPGSALNLYANGTTAGSGYDQITVGGTVSVSGVTLGMFGGLTSASPLAIIEGASGSPASFMQNSISLNGIWYSINTSGGDTTLTPSSVVTFANEVIVNSVGADDTISVSQSGATLSIVFDGTIYTASVPTAGLFIYTRGGADSITVYSSVTTQTTIETIAATGGDTIHTGGSNVIAWIDGNDTLTATDSSDPVVHVVTASNLAGGLGVSDSVPSPGDIDAVGTPVYVQDASLFGTGPVIQDVNQGEVGDCYLMASLAAFALNNPTMLKDSAVDMGDGTYIVRFTYDDSPVYVRVNNELNYAYASPDFWKHSGDGYTPDNYIWAPIIEKAFCYFQTTYVFSYPTTDSQWNTYSAIACGTNYEIYEDFDLTPTNYDPLTGDTTSPLSETATEFYDFVTSCLSSDNPITMGTAGGIPDLVPSHSYTLVSVIGGEATAIYKVRNPYGTAGVTTGFENTQGYALLTYDEILANFGQVTIVFVG